MPTDRPDADGTYAWHAPTIAVGEVDAKPVTGLSYTYTDASAAPLDGWRGEHIRVCRIEIGAQDARDPSRVRRTCARTVAVGELGPPRGVGLAVQSSRSHDMDLFTRRPMRTSRHCAACALLVAAVAALPAWGQLRPPAPVAAPDTPTQAYKRADHRMMEAMDAAPYTGDADRDFVEHMTPHHQGAIDMARVELKYGKDPTLRKLASRIIAAQRDEIALMERWQREHGAAP